MSINDLITLVGFALLVAIVVGCLAYVFIFPHLSGEKKSEERLSNLTRHSKVKAKATKSGDGSGRRKMVEETLKELEEKQRDQKRKLTLKVRLEQSGLPIGPKEFWIISMVAGAIGAFVIFVMSRNSPINLIFTIAAFAVFGLGLPRWVVNFIRARRFKKFLQHFADAIDIVVRGVKTGLPLNDTIRMIASESPEPIRSEFMKVVEGQAVGMAVHEGLERLHERVPLQEVNFLYIVVTIQSQTGGNLAESLSNLSGVLRDRRKLKGKIQAMSQEAKSSAAIIGALPFLVAFLVYITTPDYISLLWEENFGLVLLFCSAVWMSIGIFVMAKMINFDY